ncbi:hypothetical protein ECTPHS_05195 [Ectothiorhodospira sp. PHS-1]|nr:hypothetical protein ECTPHS_05195 [Ectothiorhodospira sp. PHS-1]
MTDPEGGVVFTYIIFSACEFRIRTEPRHSPDRWWLPPLPWGKRDILDSRLRGSDGGLMTARRLRGMAVRMSFLRQEQGAL